MIEVEHLSKTFGKAQAVDDISFSVVRGEILGFLGPNGAGKTTTMRMLTGYLPATNGTAKVAGYDVFEQSMEVRKRIGYMPESPPLYPEMSVHTYLEFVGRIKGLTSSELSNRVKESMQLVNIADKRDELIKRLSRGYKQRVGLAQAIVHNPDVVILDEPTVGLDPKQIIEVRKLIKGLAGGHTIVLSTHILPEVSMTCDRVVILNKGRIAAIDTPENLTLQLEGGERVRVEIKGEAAAVRSALEKVEGVHRIDIRPLESSERLVVNIESTTGRDLRSQIAACLVHSGFELYELQAVSLSLEEIFLQLTTEEQPERREPVAAGV
ncbi:MAG: ABC transporter ATP-binding protein [Acidobacteria bacterium]|nr:ABC transporter ATP-binding protein [Acidobacteriota bacterium]